VHSPHHLWLWEKLNSSSCCLWQATNSPG